MITKSATRTYKIECFHIFRIKPVYSLYSLVKIMIMNISVYVHTWVREKPKDESTSEKDKGDYVNSVFSKFDT